MNDLRRSRSSRWAPWWAYFVAILSVNYLRQALVPTEEVGDGVSVALFAATTVLVAVVVTALHRRVR